MPEQRIQVGDQIFAASDPALQAALAAVYKTSDRPRCLCVDGGLEMYVAKHGEYVCKRMPDSGPKHQPACPCFEPEPGLSGFGSRVGDSILEADADTVELRVSFPFARSQGSKESNGASGDSDRGEVIAVRRPLSLRATMHYLFEQAGFNRWAPAMEGRRNQGTLHKHLGQVAEATIVKGHRLSARLYVPERFDWDQKSAISERRREKLKALYGSGDRAQRRLALVVAQLKSVEPAAGANRKLRLLHVPDAPLIIDEKHWDKAARIFASELEEPDVAEEMRPRLIIGALIFARREGTYQVDTLSVMLTTRDYIPIEGTHELALIDRLRSEQRRFIKPLRYDDMDTYPTALLLDRTTPAGKPYPLYVLSRFQDKKLIEAKVHAAKALGEHVWIYTSGEEMPALPAKEDGA